ncbi:30S ribosomal protein S16 [Mesomycoplasma conjunctivae]|nr:30S ribosomal protein S16 [Mesomycoplasma conjunctivae]
MVKIRLKRMGSKFNPIYKIIIADARAPRDGRFIEAVGNYNPQNKSATLSKENIIKWLSLGAQPTQTVKNILTKQGIIADFIKTKNSSN